mmetsp:Transcript_51177/g.125680  ORF Transcript_51177/g.125680 Transcript_51177/m.125680 type:complete len:268 (+) Transcript_51177:213-1016(+)|eukprot:CAMPEP_0198336456 /NCGR_PEP_ID=MMETSP1450-20131203/21004_1 /TAXON_ID=753684 ORGANISM="Madagascaria erythrocladiodes, Strain CCMP3234" /NCGR_SAMPLE_ID=MMETSP1450 /ASSEMBLY_ACC=CAM_ASM_001115 /LENGTH=267 /DNA_ID=CAMNT_0044041195 /DNA_START=168 /DNA_END=971 /DNA_ORIENTATION=+
MAGYGEKYGPWALVTGASGGIGAEYARQLAARGLNVVLVARRLEKLNDVAASLKEQNKDVATRVVAADLSDVRRGVDKVVEAVADLEIGLLVNNAGSEHIGDFEEGDLDVYSTMNDLNTGAPLRLTAALSKPMVQRGRGGIIFVSSGIALAPYSYLATYGATKAFVKYLGDALSFELAPKGVDVEVVCPGFTATDMVDRATAKLDPYKLPGVSVLPVKDVVTPSLDKLGRDRTVIPGLNNAIVDWVTSVIPMGLGPMIRTAIKHAMS